MVKQVQSKHEALLIIEEFIPAGFDLEIAAWQYLIDHSVIVQLPADRQYFAAGLVEAGMCQAKSTFS
jgi:hypothetical protein